MKSSTYLSWKSIEFWLLAFITLSVFTLLFHLGLLTFQIEAFILWFAAGVLIKRNYHTIHLESGPVATACGLILLGWSLLRTLTMHIQYGEDDLLTPLAPTFAILGLALIAIGFPGLQQRWKEVLCLAFSWIPVIFVPGIMALDAKISHYFLWYLGFDVTREGLKIIFREGELTAKVIEIYYACSSIGLLLVLLKLTIALCIIYNVPRQKQITLFSLATFIAFGLNTIRVALLGVLVDQENQVAFDYWHGNSGGQIFSNVAILVFGLVFYWLWIRIQSQQSNKNVKISNQELFRERT